MSRVLYLARPIDFVVGESEWTKVVDEVAEEAALLDWLVYRPDQAWTIDTPDVSPLVEQLNRTALQMSSAMVAVLPDGVRSVGVPREIEAAKHLGIPVAVLTNAARSWSLADVHKIPFDHELWVSLAKWLDSLEEQQPSPSVVFKRTDPNAQIPTRAYPGDAGMDLYALETIELEPGDFADVPTGVHMALPSGVYARITGRSSTWRRKNLTTIEGIIDEGYRGELFAGVQNPGDHRAVIRKGERIAQLVLHTNTTALFAVSEVSPEAFDAIPGDGRGAAGFGSTGV